MGRINGKGDGRMAEKTQRATYNAAQSGGPDSGTSPKRAPGPGIGTEADEQVEESITQEDLFELLQNERRRMVAEYLMRTDEPTSIGTLAEYVAAVENDCDQESVTHRQRKRTYVSLYHGHLPKMDEYDVIDYDMDRGDVESGAEFDQLESMIEDLSEARDWSMVYIVTVALGFAGLLVVQLADSLGVLASLSIAGLTVLACLALFLLQTVT